MIDYAADDEFAVIYIPLINAAVKARTEDAAFYPGSTEFEFQALSDTIFLNHPYVGGKHSFIVGNILPESQSLAIEFAKLFGVNRDLITKLRTSGLKDALTDGPRMYADMDGKLALTLGPYEAVWLRCVDCPN